MSLLSYYKSTHDDIEKLINNHVKNCRQSVAWDGEHKKVVEDIIKIFKRLT